MNNYNKNTGKFQAVPFNEKTPDMLKMEKKLGVTFEDDYMKTYFNNPERSQRQFAKRWETNRGVIWTGNKANKSRSKTPSWVERCNLPYLNEKVIEDEAKDNMTIKCEICQIDDVTIEDAHWIPRAQKGSDKFFNIIKLCPNCHKKLDNKKDPVIIEKCRTILFSRSMLYLLKDGVDSYEDKLRMLSIAKQIINRKLE